MRYRRNTVGKPSGMWPGHVVRTVPLVCGSLGSSVQCSNSASEQFLAEWQSLPS